MTWYTNGCPRPGHGIPSDFSVRGLDGKRTWTCSTCGKQDAWSDSWGYRGTLECSGCWFPEMDHVSCSDACRPPKAPRAYTCLACGENGHSKRKCPRKPAPPAEVSE